MRYQNLAAVLILLAGCSGAGIGVRQDYTAADGSRTLFEGRADFDKNTENIKGVALTPPPIPGQPAPKTPAGVSVGSAERVIPKAGLWIFYAGAVLLIGVGAAVAWYVSPVAGAWIAGGGVLVAVLPSIIPGLTIIIIIAVALAVLVGIIWIAAQVVQRGYLKRSLPKLLIEAKAGNAESLAAFQALAREAFPGLDKVYRKAAGAKPKDA